MTWHSGREMLEMNQTDPGPMQHVYKNVVHFCETRYGSEYPAHSFPFTVI